jgi:hypothetical protein
MEGSLRSELEDGSKQTEGNVWGSFHGLSILFFVVYLMTESVVSDKG